MSDSYTPTWIAPRLAVGHAPMSYDDLKSLKNHGIDAILNLCGEYCDLHDIEQDFGFEVYYLPIPDESIPDTRNLEQALAWMDEAIYLGKSVLVHCRFGIGRTGTLVTAYLMRRGLALKSAAKLLKQSRANPSTYRQHKMLKKYSRKEKPLTIREPSLEDRHVVDLSLYFEEYEAIVTRMESQIELKDNPNSTIRKCGREDIDCCHNQVNLTLVEAIYLSYRINRHVRGDDRTEVIQRALVFPGGEKQISPSDANEETSGKQPPEKNNPRLCPLNQKESCLIYDYRPLSCRLHGFDDAKIDEKSVEEELQRLSNELFYLYSGILMPDPPLHFSLMDTVSGRFVQAYFYYLADQSNSKQQ